MVASGHGGAFVLTNTQYSGLDRVDADAFNVSFSHAATSTDSGFKCRLRSARSESRNTLGDTDCLQIDHDE